MNRIYLDNAATTPLDPQVAAAMISVLQDTYGNPSSIHHLGRESRIQIEKARKTMAALMGCAPAELFFTSGGTESDNMACRGAVEYLGIKRIVSSRLEHHAVVHTLEHLHKVHGTEVLWVPNDSSGNLDLAWLEQCLNQSKEADVTTMVTLMHGNNEIGNILDISSIAHLCRSYQALFHSDCVQTVGHYPLHFEQMGLDMLSGSAHKFYGPKGIGFILVRGGLSLGPLIQGGSQERNMRGGTETTSGIVGMALALELAVAGMEERRQRVLNLKNRLVDGLRLHFPDLLLHGNPEGASLYGVVNASFAPHPKGEMLLFHLDIEGVCASGGSACSSGAQTQSHVLQALGSDPRRHPVRFSIGAHNTEEEIDRTLAVLCQILKGSG